MPALPKVTPKPTTGLVTHVVKILMPKVAVAPLTGLVTWVQRIRMPIVSPTPPEGVVTHVTYTPPRRGGLRHSGTAILRGGKG